MVDTLHYRAVFGGLRAVAAADQIVAAVNSAVGADAADAGGDPEVGRVGKLYLADTCVSIVDDQAVTGQNAQTVDALVGFAFISYTVAERIAEYHYRVLLVEAGVAGFEPGEHFIALCTLPLGFDLLRGKQRFICHIHSFLSEWIRENLNGVRKIGRFNGFGGFCSSAG